MERKVVAEDKTKAVFSGGDWWILSTPSFGTIIWTVVLHRVQMITTIPENMGFI